MREDTAHNLVDTLGDHVNYDRWRVYAAERDSLENRIYYDVFIELQTYDSNWGELSLPTGLVNLVTEIEDLDVTLEWGVEGRHGNETLRFRLDDGDYVEVPPPEDEQQRKAFQATLQRHLAPKSLDGTKSYGRNSKRHIAEILAGAADSLDDVILASEEDLKQIDGIGEKRAAYIRDRYSNAVRDHVQEHGTTGDVVLVEDENEVLRLPDEYTNNEYTPKTPTA